MGVPRLFRWLVERYPMILRDANQIPSPAFDCLYLDFNGVVHNCAYESDAEGNTVARSEEEVMQAVFAYIELLFTIARPTQLLYIAVDGVAPRAKMNQQRQRRFRTARVAQEFEEEMKKEKEMKAKKLAEAKAKGEAVDETNDVDEELANDPDSGLYPFDSNCITPGTEFMERLEEYIEYFVQRKVAEDARWKGIKVIFSGHRVPGEGEHKIMDYIRFQKSQPGYNPNTRHCLYGLDGDLIMLALATHEPHFCLLREKVIFRPRNIRGVDDEVKTEVTFQRADNEFQYVYIGLLREYLAMEFDAFGSDGMQNLERIIDDFVFLFFLVGNDFLPPLQLSLDGMDMSVAMEIYRGLRAKGMGFVVDARANVVDENVFRAFLDELVKNEAGFVKEIKLKYAAIGIKTEQEKAAEAIESAEVDKGQTKAEPAADGEKTESDDNKSKPSTDPLQDIANEIKGALKISKNKDSDKAAEDENPMAYKDDYHELKLQGMPRGSKQHVRMISEYLQGLRWMLHYYYQGVVSWGWYYPFFAAPLASDLIDSLTVVNKTTFEPGVPLLPFQQLLGVLPMRSEKLLPKQLSALMHGELAQFYPVEYPIQVDESGKDWKAVAVIPFIDANRLVAAYEKAIEAQALSESEVHRNTLTGAKLVSHNAGQPKDINSPSPKVFPSKTGVSVSVKSYVLPANLRRFDPTVPSGCHTGLFLPPAGFPTLRQLSFKSEVRNVGVKVFPHASKNPSRVIILEDGDQQALAAALELTKGNEAAARGHFGQIVRDRVRALADGLLGRTCYAQYPYHVEALVDCIYYDGGMLKLSKAGKVLDQPPDRKWNDLSRDITRDFLQKYGIDLSSVRAVLGVRLLKGCGRTVQGGQSRVFDEFLHLYPVQAVPALQVPEDPRYIERPAPDVKQALSPGSLAVSLDTRIYGSLAHVREQSADATTLDVDIRFSRSRQERESVSDFAKDTVYLPSGEIASRCGISPLFLARITSAFPVKVDDDHEADVGLNLKYARRELEIPGYARRVKSKERQGKLVWEFSERTMELVRRYKQTFPDLFRGLKDKMQSDELTLNDLFVDEDEHPIENPLERLHEVQLFLRGLETVSLPLLPCGSSAMDSATLNSLVSTTAGEDIGDGHEDEVVIEVSGVKPEELFVPLDSPLITFDSRQRFTVGDRVVCCGLGSDLPLGIQGYAIAIHKGMVEVLWDHTFLTGHTLQGRVPAGRGSTVDEGLLLNVSRKEFAVDSRAHIDRTKGAEHGIFGAADAAGGASGKKKKKNRKKDSAPKGKKPVGNLFDLLGDE
eukprot:Clim_evm94s150 gene=Clim_evmTU94s150